MSYSYYILTKGILSKYTTQMLVCMTDTWCSFGYIIFFLPCMHLLQRMCYAEANPHWDHLDLLTKLLFYFLLGTSCDGENFNSACDNFTGPQQHDPGNPKVSSQSLFSNICVAYYERPTKVETCPPVWWERQAKMWGHFSHLLCLAAPPFKPF